MKWSKYRINRKDNKVFHYIDARSVIIEAYNSDPDVAPEKIAVMTGVYVERVREIIEAEKKRKEVQT